MTIDSTKPWNLVADIGGTNARFAAHDGVSGELSRVERYAVADYPSFELALEQYLGEAAGPGNPPAACCIAVACPADTELVKFTNSSWRIDRRRLGAELGLERVYIINDFAAVSHAVANLEASDWCALGGGAAQSDYPIAVMGPGTGCGVGSLVPMASGYQVIEGEGGHVDFAPVDTAQVGVYNILAERFGRVSIERLLSGAGIVNIYQAQARLDGSPAKLATAAEITSAALDDSCDLARRSLQMFSEVLGAAAGNLALTLGARGGVYIAGGIVPRMISFLQSSQIRQRFEDKGRFRDYLSGIPLRIVVKQDLGLHGAARKIQLAQN